MFLLLSMLFVMLTHTLLYPYQKSRHSLHSITQLTHMAPLSLSINYDASIHNTTYPEMPTLSKMDFVYER
ncbi:MAG: Unknown protein [uncultured Sulfurovum sp.]|uniref:Uncharacterized protein n=1 Tax=uncultured Sulfurovum sp. TaxID=269237 RepID=A0A6S6UAE6_9BACT|nr:MAG: Unknown protein [uncultured Sulfurovum sp.]